MDVRQLAALVAVADNGSFSAAADALHTVQSNVSTHVRRLERELGAVLVDRASGCRLTEEGEAVVARARRIQAELEAVVADVAALGAEVVGTVRLGVIGTTARWIVPLLLAAMAERHPGVRVVIVEASTTSLAPLVATGGLDAAVVNLPVSDPDLVAEPLFEEDLVLLVPADHPLAGRETATLDDVRGVPLLLPPPGTALRDDLDAAAARAGFALQPQAEVDGVRLLASLVYEGHGAAILPATAVVPRVVDEWRRIALEGLAPRHVGLATRRRGLPAAPTRAMAEVLREVVAASAGQQPGVRLAVAT